MSQNPDCPEDSSPTARPTVAAWPATPVHPTTALHSSLRLSSWLRPDASESGRHRRGCPQSVTHGLLDRSSSLLLRQAGESQPKIRHGLHYGNEVRKVTRLSEITVGSQLVTAAD